MVQTIAGLSGWMGWVIPLILTEWWLERGGAATSHARATQLWLPRPQRHPQRHADGSPVARLADDTALYCPAPR